MKNKKRFGICAGIALAAGPVLAQVGTVCYQSSPGVERLVIFADENGNIIQPTTEQMLAHQSAAKSVEKSYSPVTITDPDTGISTYYVRGNPKERKQVMTVVLGGQKALSTITITSVDGAGEGVNDLTARTPVGGNSGTTRGTQRANAMVQAATFWEDKLSSTQTITVEVDWDETLACSTFSATLGSAGPDTFFRHASLFPVNETH